MAMEMVVTKDGTRYTEPKGTAEEQKALEQSYKHLCALRDEVIAMGVLPPVDKWNELNPNV